MDDIWKGDPASQKTEDLFLKEECKNCGHERQDHFDRAGCTCIADDDTSDPKFGVYSRCHCTNFEAVEL